MKANKKIQSYNTFKISRNVIREIKLISEKSAPTYQTSLIQNSDDANRFIRQFFESDVTLYESVFILLLDNSNRTIGFAKISQGGVTCSVIDNKIIAKYAIDSLASAIILAHNHPSGNLNPSDNDRVVTDKLFQALELIDVKLIEHLIITEDSYWSFADHGLL